MKIKSNQAKIEQRLKEQAFQPILKDIKLDKRRRLLCEPYTKGIIVHNGSKWILREHSGISDIHWSFIGAYPEDKNKDFISIDHQTHVSLKYCLNYFNVELKRSLNKHLAYRYTKLYVENIKRNIRLYKYHIGKKALQRKAKEVRK